MERSFHPIGPLLPAQADVPRPTDGSVYDPNGNLCGTVGNMQPKLGMSEADQATMNPERMAMLQTAMPRAEHGDDSELGGNPSPSLEQQGLWRNQYDRGALGLRAMRKEEPGGTVSAAFKPKGRRRRSPSTYEYLFCIYCKDAFHPRRYAELLKHAKKVDHTIFCAACNKEFFSPYAWKHHLNRVIKGCDNHEEQKKHYLLCLCGETFSTFGLFRAHIVTEGHSAAYQKAAIGTPLEAGSHPIGIGSDSADDCAPGFTSDRVEGSDGMEKWGERSKDKNNQGSNNFWEGKKVQRPETHVLEALPGPQDGTAMKQLLERLGIQRSVQEKRRKADEPQFDKTNPDIKRAKFNTSATTIQSHPVSVERSQGSGGGFMGDKQDAKKSPATEPTDTESPLAYAACRVEVVPSWCQESLISDIPHKNKANPEDLNMEGDLVLSQVSQGVVDTYTLAGDIRLIYPDGVGPME